MRTPKRHLLAIVAVWVPFEFATVSLLSPVCTPHYLFEQPWHEILSIASPCTGPVNVAIILCMNVAALIIFGM
jgi:hypothetical protein